MHDAVRALSPRLVDDRSLSGDIELVADAIRSGAILAALSRRSALSHERCWDGCGGRGPVGT